MKQQNKLKMKPRKQIIRQKKVVAEFMGLEVLYRPYSEGFVELSDTEVSDVEDLPYNTDWNELMKVVEKCLLLTCDNEWHEWDLSIAETLRAVDKVIVFDELVHFIEFYNKESEKRNENQILGQSTII